MGTRTIAWLLAATVLSAGVASAADLVVWQAYRGDEKAAFEKVVADYNAARAAQGIKLTTLAVPYDAFADKITARPRGGARHFHLRTGPPGAGSRRAARSSRSTSSSTTRCASASSRRRSRR
jgi:hypothetical protein